MIRSRAADGSKAGRRVALGWEGERKKGTRLLDDIHVDGGTLWGSGMAWDASAGRG